MAEILLRRRTVLELHARGHGGYGHERFDGYEVWHSERKGGEGYRIWLTWVCMEKMMNWMG